MPPPAHFAHGTPWPLAAVPPEVGDLTQGARGAQSTADARRAAVARPFLDELDAIDHALTVPVPRQELEPEPEAEPLPPLDDMGTRTVMGIGAHAVQPVAKTGRVEAPAARREPRATPSAPNSQLMPRLSDNPTPARVIVAPSVSGELSSRRVIAARPGQVAPPVQPLHLPPSELDQTLPLPVGAPRRARSVSARPIAPIADPASAFEFLPREPARPKRKRASSSSSYRVLGISVLAIAVAALAAYIGTTIFYAFSTSWMMPVVVSQADEKVVSLRSGLAAQQNQRDRLAAELEETSRALAAQKDPKSEIAQKAGAQRKILEASIARQDAIIQGLEQSPYLRALADRASVALVPYDNLARVAPGTAVFGCSAAMVVCREVGRVLEILPGEVAFKHPRREKLLRGQMIELQLSAPDAAAQDVLFLGGAPLLF